MSPEDAPHSRPDVAPPAPGRIVVLTLVAFTAAVVVHALLGLAGFGSDTPWRLFVTPLIGGLIIFLGLRGYPTAGRWRLSIMVALGLLLFSATV